MAAGAAPEWESLPDDVAVRVLGHLTQHERSVQARDELDCAAGPPCDMPTHASHFHLLTLVRCCCRLAMAAMVCRHWRTLCQAPEVLRVIQFAVGDRRPPDGGREFPAQRIASFTAWLPLSYAAGVRSLKMEAGWCCHAAVPQAVAGLLPVLTASPAAGLLERLELSARNGCICWTRHMSGAMQRLQALILRGDVELRGSLAPLAALRELELRAVRGLPATVHLPAGLTGVSLLLKPPGKKHSDRPIHFPPQVRALPATPLGQMLRRCSLLSDILLLALLLPLALPATLCRCVAPLLASLAD